MHLAKKTVFRLLPILATLLLPAGDARAAIAWIKGYNNGLRTARNAGKPLLIDFTAKWCGWCVKLDRDTFSDGTVQKLARAFVCVKVDIDREKTAAKKWGIRGIPHILFISPDGKVLNRVNGYRKPGPFASEMQAALKRYRPQKSTKRAKPQPVKEATATIFVECAKCGNIFNTDKPKGTCPMCGTPYEQKE